MKPYTNEVATEPPRLSMTLYSSFPNDFIKNKLSKDLEQMGVTISSVLEPGRPCPPCDFAGFIQAFGSQGDEERVKKACKKAGVQVAMMPRSKTGWAESFRKAGITLKGAKPFLVHSATAGSTAPKSRSGISSEVFRTAVASSVSIKPVEVPPEPVSQVSPVLPEPVSQVSPGPVPQEPANDSTEVPSGGSAPKPETPNEDTKFLQEYADLVEAEATAKLAEAEAKRAEVTAKLAEAKARLADAESKNAALRATVDKVSLGAGILQESNSALERKLAQSASEITSTHEKLAGASRELEQLREKLSSSEANLRALVNSAAMDSNGDEELREIRRLMEGHELFIGRGQHTYEHAWKDVYNQVMGGSQPPVSSNGGKDLAAEAAKFGIRVGQVWETAIDDGTYFRRIRITGFAPEYKGSVTIDIVHSECENPVRKRISFQSLVDRYKVIA